MVKETKPESSEKKDSKNEPKLILYKDTYAPGRKLSKPPKDDETDHPKTQIPSDPDEDYNKVKASMEKIKKENEEMLSEDMRKIRQDEIDRDVINFKKKMKSIQEKPEE